MTYDDFLAQKSHIGPPAGLKLRIPHDALFDFQRVLVDWALWRGRAAIFADCGLGKTLMQLVWADTVVRDQNRPVLILTPLAVGPQTLVEAHKFSIEASRSRDGKLPAQATIVITNYEQLHKFSPHDFAGVVCDESSILKSFDGTTASAVIQFLKQVPYRLLCTATAAPNDYFELGTSSEALGEYGYMDMLTRFFVNDQHSSHPMRRDVEGGRWRFKGHAEEPFWRWIATWARALQSPADIGCDASAFVLPPLVEQRHVVEARRLAPGMLFALPARDMREEREERRRTIEERCERVVELVKTNSRALIWCHLNDEGNRLAKLIPEAEQIAGADSDDRKEAVYSGFSEGTVRILITKPKIGAWGMNWQHCAHVVTFASHSYEQYYQSIRRCWRFGQRLPVTVDIVTTEGEARVFENLQRKARNAERMFRALVAHMQDATGLGQGQRDTEAMEIPSWVSSHPA